MLYIYEILINYTDLLTLNWLRFDRFPFWLASFCKLRTAIWLYKLYTKTKTDTGQENRKKKEPKDSATQF